MKGIQIEDIRALRFPSSVEASPNGETLAYTLHQSNEKGDGYDSWLYWMDVKTGSINKLTYRGKESGCVWDDAQTLLFAASREKEDEGAPWKPLTAFYRLPVTGGEARKAFSVPLNVMELKKIGEGEYCALAGVDLNQPADEDAANEEKDYHVIEEIPLWANGKGFVSRKRASLYWFSEKTGECEKLSPDFFNVSGFDFQDGKIAYFGREFRDKAPVQGECRLYDIAAKTEKTIVAPGVYSISNAIFAGGGLVLAMSDMLEWGSGQNHAFYRWSEQDGLRFAVNPEAVIGGSVLTDSAYGGGKHMIAKGGEVYFVGLEGHRQNVYVLHPDDTVQKAIEFPGTVLGFDLVSGGYAFVSNAGDRPVELYLSIDGQISRATHENDALAESRDIGVPEPLNFVNSDGIEIEGWVLKPVGFDPEKRYPGVLEIHGGPRCAYDDGFFHEMQAIRAKGMFVFFCNPRGGEGYGEAFADLRGKYGEIDYRDLMEFTDAVLAKWPQLDKKRLGASGGSYGGFMCNWIEGHTDRFAAIASQRSIANWISDFVSSEIGTTFDQNEMGGATPWTDVEKIWSHSPLKYADQAKTPILFIHSMCDYNCTLDQGVEMFTAMKLFGVPSRMVLFEGENHSLSRSGKPKHRERRLREIIGWFVKYLLPEAEAE